LHLLLWGFCCRRELERAIHSTQRAWSYNSAWCGTTNHQYRHYRHANPHAYTNSYPHTNIDAKSNRTLDGCSNGEIDRDANCDNQALAHAQANCDYRADVDAVRLRAAAHDCLFLVEQQRSHLMHVLHDREAVRRFVYCVEQEL
jgi:hypothetical protein